MLSNRLVLAALPALLAASPAPASEVPAPADRPTLAIEPPAIALGDPLDRLQVVVTRHSACEGLADATRAATFAVEPPGIARVSRAGVVTPEAPGEGRLIASVDGVRAEVPIIVDLPDRGRAVSFRHDVSAVLARAGCNMGACHGNLNGKGGFKLSLRGDDPAFDYLMLTRDAFGRRVQPADPDASLILRKPTGRAPHEGGARFAVDSVEAKLLRSWLADGAGDDGEAAPELAGLRIWPAKRINAAPTRSQQVRVVAAFDDGSERDVTHLAAFDVGDPTRTEVDPSGMVRRDAPGESIVAARYLGAQAVARVAFLADRPAFAWDGPGPRTELDRAVFDRLRAFKIHASAPAADSTFLRRAFLDAIGTLPSPERARRFLESDDPDKRVALVDELLERPEFADHWALKWADLLRNEEETMGPKGVWAFRRWLRDRIADDEPITEVAEALITGTGSTWASPPASFYRTNRDPETCAESFGQIFLGVRLQCARCHNHPFDSWTQDDYYGLAAAFSNVRRKEIDNRRRDGLNKHVINGDVVVHLAGRPGMVQPNSGERLPPKAPDGPVLEVGPDLDARDALADWLTADNRQFSRTVANRVWYHLMGRGVVHPVDDFRASNPPSNPALLDALTDAFEGGGARLKPLVRLVMTSEVYGLDAHPRPTNEGDEANFAHARVKLIPAEVLLDALGHALGRPADLEGTPPGSPAIAMAGARAGPEFLKVFGKPERLLTCECERSESTTLAQAFQLINGDVVRGMLEAPDNRIGRLLDEGADPDAILDELYLAALCRVPGDPERAAALSHLSSVDEPRRAWEDIAWAIVNSKEFLLRH